MARRGSYLLWSFLVRIVFIPSCLGGQCPASWYEADQSCYRLLTDVTMTGGDAAKACQDLGGGLAVPGSQPEQDAIWELIQAAGVTTDVYIGCRSPDGYAVNLVCREHGGTVRSYRHWEQAEPTGDYQASGRCVRIRPATGKWNDIPCKRTFANVLCETSHLLDEAKMPLTCLTADVHGRFFQES